MWIFIQIIFSAQTDEFGLNRSVPQSWQTLTGRKCKPEEDGRKTETYQLINAHMEPFKIKKKKKKLLCHTWLKVKPEYHREMKGFMSHWLSLFYAAEIKTDFNRLENKTIFKYVLTYCLNLCSWEARSKCLITSQSQILWPILPTEKPFATRSTPNYERSAQLSPQI